MFGDLVDVEGELGLNMLVLPFGVVDAVAVFVLELGELDGDGDIGGLRMADGVADVVGERADGKGELVGVAGVAEEIDDEIAGADVVGEIGEGRVAEGIVADVLNDTAAVGVSASVLKLGWGEGGITAEEKWNDGLLPGEIDELLVREEGVCAGRFAHGKDKDYDKQNDRGPEFGG